MTRIKLLIVAMAIAVLTTGCGLHPALNFLIDNGTDNFGNPEGCEFEFNEVTTVAGVPVDTDVTGTFGDKITAWVEWGDVTSDCAGATLTVSWWDDSTGTSHDQSKNGAASTGDFNIVQTTGGTLDLAAIDVSVEINYYDSNGVLQNVTCLGHDVNGANPAVCPTAWS